MDEYREALERAKQKYEHALADEDTDAIELLEELFPQLKESPNQKASRKLRQCVCRSINDGSIPYQEREYISRVVLQYVDRLESLIPERNDDTLPALEAILKCVEEHLDAKEVATFRQIYLTLSELTW